ncbi:MAG: STAS domain-containing protein [Candidatus Muirbacterium halophilum]|nr:STAS domain-containing protein [Candidatus Muirbacterium halophilum]MCK9477652.1 STAS domain-containing protein [Candidatus Muirbacterium halophilum]
MKINTEKIDDIIIIKIEGEIEKEDEIEIRDFFDDLIEIKRAKKIIIDASKIQYLGSSTLGVFSKLYQKVTKNGGRLTFASLSHFVKKIFKITTFDNYFSIKYNVKDAIDDMKEK